jgi:hypothetical protein
MHRQHCAAHSVAPTRTERGEDDPEERERVEHEADGAEHVHKAAQELVQRELHDRTRQPLAFLPALEGARTESSWSIVSWSLLSRETIRPIGVVSKKCVGEKSTPLSAALNSLKPECSEIRLRDHQSVSSVGQTAAGRT